MQTKRLFSSICALSFFSIIFFNSFVDLGHKIIIQNIFYDTSTPEHFTIMSSIVNAMILIPYVILFSPSGFIADRFSKALVMQFTAWAAVPLTLIITYFYYHGQFWPAFSITLLLAVQSTFNSPAKYGYVKEFFNKEYITKANAVAQSITMLAILSGTFIFSLIYGHLTKQSIHKDEASILLAIAPSGWVLVCGSLLEAILTSFLVRYPAASKASFKISQYVTGRYLWQNIKFISLNSTILYCIISLALFWGVNQVVIAAYGAYLKEVTHVSVVFVQGCFAIAIIGILLGATSSAKISKRFIEPGSIPFAILALSILLWIMVSVTNLWVIMGLFLVYGYFSGILVVPLNALIQFNAPDNALGKVLAGNNFLQFLLMLLFLGATVIFSYLNVNAILIFRVLAVISFIWAIFALKMLPQSFIRFMIWWWFSRIYKVDVVGLNNLPSSGGVLLLGNHVSYMDWAIVAIASPRPVRFVMDRGIYEHKLLNWLLKLCNVIPISRGSGSKSAISSIRDALNQGDVVALFPEGYLSRNGQLGAFFRGFERAIEDTSATIVPFYIHGMWGSLASYSSLRYRAISKNRRMREVTFAFGEQLSNTTKAAELRQAVAELSGDVWRNVVTPQDNVARAWCKRMKQEGRRVTLIDAPSRTELSGYDLLATVWRYKALLKPMLKEQGSIGIVLPNSVDGIIANLACLCLGKAVVNLNCTDGLAALEDMIAQANVTTIISGTEFLANQAAIGATLQEAKGVKIVYVEDIKARITPLRMLQYIGSVRILPNWILCKMLVKSVSSSDTAAILFSNSSDGIFRGIELSHYNILSNINQVACVLNLQKQDIVLSSLPLYNSFGLVVTSLMPLLIGSEVVCTPDPANREKVARAIAGYEVTILCSTPTLLNFYTMDNNLDPLMFNSLRLVISGSEKLTDNIRQAFHNKFLLGIYEGYGSKSSLVVSINLPNILVKGDWHVQTWHKVGSVGLPLPGTLVNIIDPVTKQQMPFGEDGLILVSGPQVMKGYLNPSPKISDVLIKHNNKLWYQTGDKGHLDEAGFLTIVD